MDPIKINYRKVRESLPGNVQLAAVSKTHTVEQIKKVYDLGQRIFAENKVQELLVKYPELPQDIDWHLIGHLQSNKVKYIVPFVSMIESLDSEKILVEVDKEAKKIGRKINALLQVKIAQEDSKFGFDKEEARQVLIKYSQDYFPNITIKGLMGMASFTEDQEQVKREFDGLKAFFDELQSITKLSVLSMGMSGDYKTAIESGSNSVRLGSAIFGQRDYLSLK